MTDNIQISIIAAVAENNVIGKDNDMPWRISADFKHFKSTTMGHPMVMGRKTFESLPGLLPGRPHIVVSRSGFEHEEAISAFDLEDGITKAKNIALQKNQSQIFIIGGSQIYKQAIEISDKLIITDVHKNYDGDTFFPEIDLSIWKEISREHHGGDPAFSFVEYTRQ